MNNFAPPLSLALILALGLLGGCHFSTRVTDKNVEAPADKIGDASSNRFDAPVRASEQSRKTTQLVPSDGMSWRWDAGRTTASFGPSPTATAFSIECDPDHDQLIFHRLHAGPAGSVATMSFTGNGHVASLPAATIGDDVRQTSSWQAAAPPSELTSAVAKVFDGTAPVEIALSGTTELVAAASPITQRPFAACRR